MEFYRGKGACSSYENCKALAQYIFHGRFSQKFEKPLEIPNNILYNKRGIYHCKQSFANHYKNIKQRGRDEHEAYFCGRGRAEYPRADSICIGGLSIQGFGL